LFGIALAFPAIAYQAPVLAWVYLIVIAITLFTVIDHWDIIAFLEVAIMAPFAPFPFSLLSGFLFLLLGIAALRYGSSRSIFISIPAILMVLILSTIWLQPTSSFITISNNYQNIYGPAMEQLQNKGQPEVGIGDLVSSAGGAVASFVGSWQYFMPALEKIGSNIFKLLIQDSAIVQLAVWAIVLFIVGFLPAHLNYKYKQTIAACALFLVPIVNFFVAPAFGNLAEPLSFFYCFLSVAGIAVLESQGIKMSGEKKAIQRAKQKAFGKFGDADLPQEDSAEMLSDIGGYEDVKDELKAAIITPIKNPEYLYTYGIKPPKGILLFGPPGTGKTMLMRALANELDVGFRYVKCSDLLSEWYGESEKNLAEVFEIARKGAPFLLFFDEIDSIGKKRDSYTGDDVAPRVMSVLLQELDGFAARPKKPVIFVGATNMPEQLDSALMRPGRFDKIIYMPLPDFNARKAIFKVHLSKLPKEDAIDYDKLASMTERYSGADIKNLCTEASITTARAASKAGVVIQITTKHLLDVIKRIKPSVSLSQIESYSTFRKDYERRSEAEEKKPDEKGVRWEDVAGLEDVHKILREAIEYPLLHADLMKEMDVKPSKGLLLFGPPGCGKTMIVKAAANELNANFLMISGAELTGGKNRDPASYVKEVFNRARENAPALIFIDEIEALAPSRDKYRGGILTELLQELDGVKELNNVMIVGATNKPSEMDSAILRPGRFDKIVYIPPPDEPARAQVFKTNLAKFLGDLDLNQLASATDGFTGADITSICQEVKMQLVRDRLQGKKVPEAPLQQEESIAQPIQRISFVDKILMLLGLKQTPQASKPTLPKFEVLRKSSNLSTERVMTVIKTRRPSVTTRDLKEYFAFMSEYGERK
ncbi:MAG: AAA family ATPase, partial [Candidatus Micrarchaeota archaeon]|nr:AAA family ATPase [Candidatus Micrarchaeota archaeon]